jgi:hypothetical protein
METRMTFSLYDALIPSFRQILGSVAGLLDKAEAHCDAVGLPHGTIFHARLADDMLPFAYQVKSAVVHSAGAIEGVRRGSFSPDTSPPPASFAGLRERVAGAEAALAAIDRAEVDGFIGRDMRFTFGDRHVDYRAENFLLSFSQPNFYFHATTAYDLMRLQGVALGKRDFLGRVNKDRAE